MSDRRPSPEQLLERAAREAERAQRGKLRIFFGAAPGVGKTFAMLEDALARRRAGVDVVIGVVETHGRAETERLTAGLERIPPRTIEHRGIQLAELDLDAALARRPALILVDELAHTNAPGSRHAKRWQDVEELLQAGIDVHATLNVQHVETLNDVVAQITGVKVQETVPDSIVDLADEIELVDLSPDDLLQRLREGKVYVPAQAERALQAFFRKGNLIALRELALRKTAERVDAQAEEWKREHGIGAPWPTRERVLVALGPDEQAFDVLRAARRIATGLDAPWIAMLVETPAFERLGEDRRERAAELIALAERLGAEPYVVRSDRPGDEILSIARERDVTRIVVGKPRPGRLRSFLQRSLVDHLVRNAEGIEVVVTAGESGPKEREKPAAPLRPPAGSLLEYAWALLPIAASTGLCLLLRDVFELADHAMVHLLGVLVAASNVSRGPSLFAAIAAVAALDFFFVEPALTFAVGDLRHVVTFAVMLAVGLVVGNRTVRMREAAASARERERRTAALFAMSRAFTVEDEPATIARVAERRVAELFGCEAVVLLRAADGGLAPLSGETAGGLAEPRELAVARWVVEHGREAGHGADTLPGSRALFLPLIGAGGTLGALGVALGDLGREPSPSQRQLLETFVAQIALALERVLLREDASRSKLAVETERLRTDLLSSVGHDLRTPLASITGAASALEERGWTLDRKVRDELLATIKSESERLSRLVANLLDLTRLDSGAMVPEKAWVPVEEIAHSALARVEETLAGRRVELELPEQVLLVPVDPVLVEQALVNLLENAVKYGPPGAPIELRVRGAQGAASFEVSDRGPGLPPGEEERVFEKFYRVPDSSRAGGAGLGLTVARAIVRAHGGAITAENRLGGGATFRFEIPIEGVPPAPIASEPVAGGTA